MVDRKGLNLTTHFFYHVNSKEAAHYIKGLPTNEGGVRYVIKSCADSASILHRSITKKIGVNDETYLLVSTRQCYRNRESGLPSV